MNPPFHEPAFLAWFDAHQPIYRINREVTGENMQSNPGQLSRAQIVAIKHELEAAFVAGSQAAIEEIQRLLQEKVK